MFILPFPLLLACTALIAHIRAFLTQIVLAFLYIISYVQVHAKSFYRKYASVYLYDYVVSEDIGINLRSVWCVHSQCDSTYTFYQHQIDLETLPVCSDSQFVVIDYQICDESNSKQIYTYYLDPGHPFETCSPDALAMTPIPLHFLQFNIRTKQNLVVFDVTSLMNRALGPLSDFHSDLASRSRSMEIVQYMMFAADEKQYYNWKTQMIRDDAFGDIAMEIIVSDGFTSRSLVIDANISDTDLLCALAGRIYDLFEN